MVAERERFLPERNTKSSVSDWFLQWQAPLRRFLRGRAAVPSADIEDVAQEVFLRLLRYDRADLVEHPQAYLYKMASNVAAEWAIRSRNKNPHDSRWLSGLATAEDPQRHLARDAAESEVRRAIVALGPKQCEMLKLYVFGGLGHAQIAQQLGVTKRSVKRILIKSYARLRQDLDPRLLGELTDGRE